MNQIESNFLLALKDAETCSSEELEAASEMFDLLLREQTGRDIEPDRKLKLEDLK